MKHLSIIFVSLFLLVGKTAHTQGAPGFMGKRCFVESQLGVNALWFNLLGELDTDDGLASVIGVSPGFSLNYVVGRHRITELELSSRSFRKSAFVNIGGNNGDKVNFLTQINSYGLGCYSTFRRRVGVGTLAPLGMYGGYKLSYNQLSSRPQSFVESGNDLNMEELEAYESKYENPALNFVSLDIAYGYRTVVKERVTLYMGMDIGFSIARLSSFYSREKLIPLYEDELNDYIRFYVNLNVGAGYLLF